MKSGRRPEDGRSQADGVESGWRSNRPTGTPAGFYTPGSRPTLRTASVIYPTPEALCTFHQPCTLTCGTSAFRVLLILNYVCAKSLQLSLTLGHTGTVAHQAPLGFPGGSAVKKRLPCRSYRRRRFDPWVGKIPWRRAWQPTLVFLPGESPRMEEPGELQSTGHRESDND